jgi:putative endonuclease
MYFVYILYSNSLNRYYVGYTSNLDERLTEHNSGVSSYTRKGIPWVLMYSETFDNKTDAIKRENYIKRMKSRKYIEGLFSTVNNN